LIRSQNHPEFKLFFEASRNHQLVSRFEDVERKLRAWHQHHVERK
jgi:hypothetical protein